MYRMWTKVNSGSQADSDRLRSSMDSNAVIDGRIRLVYDQNER